jgi:outer membrane protein TolC
MPCGEMKTNAVTAIRIVTFVLLFEDSALSSGDRNDASHFRRVPAPLPSQSGKVFLFDGKIGGLNGSEPQIYENSTVPDWSKRTPPLSELLDEALQRNPTTRQTWETANAAAANFAASKGMYWPTATVTSVARPSYTQGPTFPGYVRTTEFDYNPTLQVQYLLFDFGGRAATVDAARFSFLASGFAINQSLQTVALAVLKNYYSLVQAKEAIAIAENSLQRVKAIIAEIENASAEAKDLSAALTLKKSSAVPLPGSPRTAESLGADVGLDRQKAKIQALAEQKELEEPNLLSFQLSAEVANGAVKAATIQLLTAVGVAADTAFDQQELPISSLPCASLFSEEDFVPNKLCDLINKLTGQTDLVSKFVWQNFRLESQNRLKPKQQAISPTPSPTPTPGPEEQQQGCVGQLAVLVEEFNRIVQRRVRIYDDDRFAGVILSDETRKLLALNDKELQQERKISRLNRLLLEDAYPFELNMSSSPTHGPPIEAVPAKVDEMIVDALESRPDLANKYFAYKSARAQARQAESNIYPNLTATINGSTTAISKTVTSDQGSGTTETSNSGRADSFVGALTVTIPVFDALTLVNKARAARATAAAARADLANAELNAISDVATNFEAYKSAVTQYELALSLAVDAADALKTAEKKYREALKDYKTPNGEKSDPCEASKQQDAQQRETPAVCQERKKRQNLETALNALVTAQNQFDTATTKWSSTKLSVFTSSFQLANATGALLPKYRLAGSSAARY